MVPEGGRDVLRFLAVQYHSDGPQIRRHRRIPTVIGQASGIADLSEQDLGIGSRMQMTHGHLP